MVMRLRRFARHLLSFRSRLGRHFDAATRRSIREAVEASERTHRGEIRFAVESRLDAASVWAGKTARERALELFASLRVWDTAENSGILVYVLLADQRMEIVADRGYTGGVTEEQWQEICDTIDAAYREGRFREGSVDGVHACARHAARLFPSDGSNANELADEVVVL
jgi:uncharacterized membrane protein YgcG